MEERIKKMKISIDLITDNNGMVTIEFNEIEESEED